ncbi:MAG: hypothetical protein ACM31L_15370 [Actinomycetota bacterium]
MSKTSRFILGGLELPLDLHTVVGGGAAPATNGAITFDFAYRGIRFGGRYDDSVGSGRLKVAGDLGPLPFSAESPHARAGLACIVERATEAIGPVLRIVQGRILVGAEHSVELPVTAISLVTAVAQVLLPVSPYLDLVATYLRPPMAVKPGESALRSEWRRRVSGPGR